MVDIVYPTSLRVPQTSNVTPAERRALSQAERPREARPRERDRRKFERVQFRPMTPAEAQIFRDWWRDDLILGGAWFSADWPLPEGYVTAVRKFVGAPRWEYVPGGMWRVSAFTEVRGRSLMPTQPAPGTAPVIAWSNPIASGAGTITADSEGTREDYESADFHELYAGIVGYTSGSASWSLDWLPFLSQTAPVLTPLAGGRVKVTFYREVVGGSSDLFGAGIATISCTLDGQAASVELTAMMGSDFYSPLAWRTADPLLELGWNTEVHNDVSLSVHSNDGSEAYPGFLQSFYATVCDYDQVTTPAVTWDTDWIPFASDPAPNFYASGYGQEMIVEFTDVTSNSAARGTVILTATVGGQPTNSIQIVVGAGPFNTITWGPVP